MFRTFFAEHLGEVFRFDLLTCRCHSTCQKLCEKWQLSLKCCSVLINHPQSFYSPLCPSLYSVLAFLPFSISLLPFSFPSFTYPSLLVCLYRFQLPISSSFSYHLPHPCFNTLLPLPFLLFFLLLSSLSLEPLIITKLLKKSHFLCHLPCECWCIETVPKALGPWIESDTVGSSLVAKWWERYGIINGEGSLLHTLPLFSVCILSSYVPSFSSFGHLSLCNRPQNTK